MKTRGGPGLLPALAYGGFCAFALGVVVLSTQPLHRLWGSYAAAAYGCAALLSLTRLRWRRELLLAVTVVGALVAPLCWLAATGQGMPEVGVVAHSAELLVQHGRLYESAAQLGGNVNGYNPYLPGMALFGLPQALLGGGAATDPRVWDGIAFVLLFAGALRVAGVRGPMRRTAVLASSPLIAFPLTVSGNDLPVLGLLCLGLAFAAQRNASRAGRTEWLARVPWLRPVPGPVLAGVALGAAAALKATAWPALLVVGVLFAVRDGRGAVGRFSAAAAAVLALLVGPILIVQPRDLVENTIAFPLGLTKAHSPAASPLPGHLLAATGAAGHLAVIALMVAAAVLVGVALLLRPPRTVVSAAGYLALTLTLLFTLAPATRWGYFVYPLGIGCWLCLSGLVQPRTAWPPRLSVRPPVGGPSAPGVRPAPEIPGENASGAAYRLPCLPLPP